MDTGNSHIIIYSYGLGRKKGSIILSEHFLPLYIFRYSAFAKVIA